MENGKEKHDRDKPVEHSCHCQPFRILLAHSEFKIGAPAQLKFGKFLLSQKSSNSRIFPIILHLTTNLDHLSHDEVQLEMK